MPRIKPNIVAVTVFIDGQPSALFFKGTEPEHSRQTWRGYLADWVAGMIRDGHTIKYDMFWRSDAQWPACGCPQKWAAPNAFNGMLAKEGAGRRLEDIRFEAMWNNKPGNKKAHASFKASAS